MHALIDNVARRKILHDDGVSMFDSDACYTVELAQKFKAAISLKQIP